jgi:hypothetical protein
LISPYSMLPKIEFKITFIHPKKNLRKDDEL